MKKKVLILVFFIALFLAVPSLVSLRKTDSSVSWSIVPERTRASFKVKHFILMEVEGRFSDTEGSVVTTGVSDFSKAIVEAKIPVKTVYTKNQDRDDHLRKDDFFNAEKYPYMIFKSTSVKKLSSGSYEMNGELTIRDVTKPVKLVVEHKGVKNLKNGVTRSSFLAKGTLNRYDYGLTWNELTEAGSMVVGKNVTIELDVTLEQTESRTEKG
jgi:polyisoprenoid-binding protein YceI